MTRHIVSFAIQMFVARQGHTSFAVLEIDDHEERVARDLTQCLDYDSND
jgi:hypothetical protein